jgi:phage tail sheath gpL-like
VGSTTTDGSVTWTCEYAILTGGLVPFYGGTGTESVSLALAAIAQTQYDRIAAAQNDATNLGLYKTQIDAAAGPTINILEQVVTATNGTLAAAASLSQTTLNDTRFGVLWYLNCETHPCEISASFAALRSSLEAGNPAQGYDNAPLLGVAIQSQTADYANHATLVAALNEGVTPVQNYNGQACIVRAIVTHSLNGSTPDYSTLDTSDLTVPDQMRQTVRLYWVSYFKPNNPVVSPDPTTSAGGQLGAWPPSGVATPKLWNIKIVNILKQWESGTTFPYPQLQLGSVANFPPVTVYSSVQNCLLSAISVVPIALDHQIGVSVRGIQGGPASLVS